MNSSPLGKPVDFEVSLDLQHANAQLIKHPSHLVGATASISKRIMLAASEEKQRVDQSFGENN